MEKNAEDHQKRKRNKCIITINLTKYSEEGLQGEPDED
tara:strand:+ start:5282 stop:5395 length:114 start_codon:yes stop_codon:yes gene_type:complete